MPTPLSTNERQQWLEELLPVARAAGRVVMELYAKAIHPRGKADGSPVTAADEQAEALIRAALKAWTPALPILAEEAFAAGTRPAPAERFWLVDPLDGTREFIARNGEFTINIALIEDGRPSMGVVFAPALGRLFAGARDAGAFVEEHGQRRPVQVRTPPAEGLSVLVSRSHSQPAALQDFLAQHRVGTLKPLGSSLKLGLIAAGEADLYPRLGPTMEWDTAAGQAVLEAAGGRVETRAGEALRYGKPGLLNPPFIACGG